MQRVLELHIELTHNGAVEEPQDHDEKEKQITDEISVIFGS